MQDTVPAAQVADLLAAIREALTAPDPAGEFSAYERVITLRASYLRALLNDPDLGDLATMAQYAREASRVVPVRYEAAGGEGK